MVEISEAIIRNRVNSQLEQFELSDP